MEMLEECLFEDAEAMKSLMLHVISVFLLETNLLVFSCSATGDPKRTRALFTGIHLGTRIERFCCCHKLALC